MMYGCILDRNGLSDVLLRRTHAPKSALEIVESTAELSDLILGKDRIVAIWPDKNCSEIPYIIATDLSARRDWLAWLTTYMTMMRPFTAYCRVMDIESSILLIEGSTTSSSAVTLNPSYISLILGETLASDERFIQQRHWPLLATSASGSLSYCISRSILVHRSVIPLGVIAERWTKIRNFVQQRSSNIQATSIIKIFSILMHLDGFLELSDEKLRGVAAACRIMTSQHAASPTQLANVLASPFAQLLPLMDGTRQESVSIVERSISRLPPSSELSEEDVFTIGLLASLIAPGTLAHAQLLTAILPVAPSALFWYATCVGFSPGTKFLSELGGSGRRLARDLRDIRSWPSRPTADISWLELEMNIGSSRLAIDFPVSSSASLTVELAPLVNLTVQWTNPLPSKDGIKTSSRESIQLLNHISSLVDRLNTLHNHLSDERDRFPERTEIQREMFDVDRNTLKPESKPRKRAPQKLKDSD